MRFTPTNITELKDGEIFVFGSNLEGRHGKGAALTAMKKFGAKWGVAEGMTGKCYALPTVGRGLSKMSLDAIKRHVDAFRKCAANHPGLWFLVTEVGCGLAGHKVEDVAPMFDRMTDNVILPKSFAKVLRRKETL